MIAVAVAIITITWTVNGRRTEATCRRQSTPS